MSDVIYAYTLQQAIEDGVLVEVFKNHWNELTGGKPLVATAAVHREFTLAALQEIWNDYVVWRKQVMPKLPEAEQLFSTKMNDQTIWVMEDGQAFTILFPAGY